MKSIFKFMTVALAAGLAVSCSDDLNLEQKATLHVEKGDLVGTLYSEVPTRVAILDEMDDTGYPAVWSDDDAVNVFSSKRLNFNQYTLKEGAGTNQAVFQPIEEDETLLASKDLYAITEASYQYGVSAVDANSGQVLLTAEIPQSFEWEKVINDEGDEVNAYKLPSPYWGDASFGSNGELNVGFRPLTAVLRCDLSLLPEGVHAIVLVSGNSMFPGATYNVYGKNAQGEWDHKNAAKKYSGTGEGISGFFNAVLDYESADRPALGIDRALVCQDTLRVDLPEATEKNQDLVLYLPLIAQHYDDLKVIAVMDDVVDPYEWGGEILRTFTDQEIVNGRTYQVVQTAEVEIAATSPLEISKEIASMYDGKHALIVSVPNIELSSDDNTIYIVSDTKGDVGNTDVTINFPQKSLSGLNIVEASAKRKVGDDFNGFNMGTKTVNNYAAMTRYLDPEAPEFKSGKRERRVTLNFNYFADQVNITLPTSDLIMSSAQTITTLNITTSNTSNVSGWDANAAKMESNEQNAALKFKGTYGTVNYWSGAVENGKYWGGAVYFFDEESEITNQLNIYGQNPYSLRITDAMVKEIHFPTLGNNPTTYIYTTGSAAIKHLNENGNKVKIKAYWTGKRLTKTAVGRGYEGSEVYDAYYGINSETAGVIYTAAQLQGMGMAENKYAYTISPKVESIWLGGIDWPWIGAEIEQLGGESWYNSSTQDDAITDGGTENSYNSMSSYTYRKGNGNKITKEFSLDGRNVELKNMILDIYDPDIELPGCCGTTQKVRLLNNIGLIRSIRTTKTVDIFNIQLDDVLLDTHGYAIDNIGSLVGIIDAEKKVTIGGKKDDETVSKFTDIRIISKGNQIGGIVGELECADSVVIDKVKVESIENNNTYIHGGHIQGQNNVGGLVGRVTYDEAYKGTTPEFGSIEYAYDTPLGIQPLTKGANNENFFICSKHDKIQKMDPNTGAVLNSRANFYTRTRLVAGDGTISYQYNPQAENTLFPEAGVNYFYLSNDGTQIVEVGTVKNGTDDRQKLTGKYTGYKGGTGDDKNSSVTKEVSFPDETTGSYEGVLVKDGDSWIAYNLTAFDPNKDYAYNVTDVFKETVSSQVSNDYPVALTISNATVTLTPKTSEGIILGEKGNNVGGMVGDVLMNGAANVHKNIKVTVPTISATTKETTNQVHAAMTKVGNNVGGLLGEFLDMTNKVTSNFGGTIKCDKGITGDGQRVGGVLGLQLVASTEATNTLNQVTIGNQSSCSVEVGELRAENGWVGGLVGNQEEGSLLINGNAANTVKVNIKTALKGANCMGGMIGENTGVTIISNDGKNSVTIADVALTKDAPYYLYNANGQFDTSATLYLGTVGTLVGQKNATLKVVKSGNLAVSPAGFSDEKKDELLFGLHGSAATTEISPNTKKFWGDSNNGYVGYAKMTANYTVDGHEAQEGNTQQGNYGFNIEKVYEY